MSSKIYNIYFLFYAFVKCCEWSEESKLKNCELVESEDFICGDNQDIVFKKLDSSSSCYNFRKDRRRANGRQKPRNRANKHEIYISKNKIFPLNVPPYINNSPRSNCIPMPLPCLPQCPPILPPCTPRLPPCTPILPPCPPRLPPFPPILPPCPPRLPPCPPMNNSFNYSPIIHKRRPDIASLVYKLLEQTKCEFSKAVSIYTQLYLTDVQNSVAKIQQNLNNSIKQLNTNLLNTISQKLGNSQNSTSQRLLEIITQNNNTLLTGINSLVTTANSLVKTNISTLATLSAAQITTSIQNLTTQAGTLQQILAIITDIQTGTNTLFQTQNQNLIQSIKSILSQEQNALQSSVINSVNTSNSQIGGIVGSAAAESFATIVFNFKKLTENITLAYKTSLQEYNNGLNRLVVEYFTCLP